MVKITSNQVVNNKGEKYDATTVVGTGQAIETIEDMLQLTHILRDGMIVQDFNNSVAWQVYYDGANWGARIYDGVHYLKAIGTTPLTDGFPLVDLEPQGQVTLDGILCTEGNKIGVLHSHPNLHGIWIVHEDEPWTRDPIFDQSADKLSNITFIVEQGNVFANSQWRFTTIGAVTPETLSSSYEEFITDPEAYFSYTWLNFEMIGGEYPTRVISGETTGSIYRYDLNTSVTADVGDIILGFVAPLPGKTYRVTKADSSANTVYVYNIQYSLIGEGWVGTETRWALTEQNDYVDVRFTDNAKYGEATFSSNRLIKILSPSQISADGRLDVSSPYGYKLYGMKLIATGGTSDPNLNIGITPTGSELTTQSFTNDTEYWVEVLDSLTGGNNVTDVYVSESGSGTWYGATAQFYLYYVKQDIELSGVTEVSSATYDVLPTDNILHVTYTSTGAVTNIELQSAQVKRGRIITVKDAGGNASGNNITITTEGAETIDGSATTVISTNYGSVELYCDGTNWFKK